ncbi:MULTISPECIES: hypothetical protein [unclassified Pseudomonas]|nr:hypothetical protein [Pseudomonas sp. SWI36]
MPTKEQLEKAQAISTIFATIAVPIIVAVFGWVLQSQTSADAVKKDYVQMAVNILNSEKSDEEMRGWAVAVLDRSSPVPFTRDMKDSIRRGESFIAPVFQLPPSILMEPPESLKPLKEEKPTLRDLMINTVENYSICKKNSLKLESLQELLRKYEEIYNGKNKDKTNS